MGGGGGGGGGGGKTSKEEIHHKLSTNGPNHATRLRGHHSGHGNNCRLTSPNWCTPQMPLSHGFTGL